MKCSWCLQGSTPLHYAAFTSAIGVIVDIMDCFGQETGISVEDEGKDLVFLLKVNLVIWPL